MKKISKEDKQWIKRIYEGMFYKTLFFEDGIWYNENKAWRKNPGERNKQVYWDTKTFIYKWTVK